jgi:hypothetical protein
VLVHGRDIERIDETGVYLRLGSDVSAGQVTLISDPDVFSNSPRLSLLEVVAANEPPSSGRKLLENSLPKGSGMSVIRLSTNADVKMPLKPRGILGEFRFSGGKGTLIPSLTVTTPQGRVVVAVKDLPVPTK